MVANRIAKYLVRIPGDVTRSEHRTERAAHRACRAYGPGYRVYATHADGSTTGPYRTDDRIARIRREIAAGTYVTDAKVEATAERMLGAVREVQS